MPKVTPITVRQTEPGSRNPWRLEYPSGAVKWTQKRPGTELTETQQRQKEESFLGSPAVKRAIKNFEDVCVRYAKGEADKDDVEGVARQMETSLGYDHARRALRTVRRHEWDSAPEAGERSEWQQAVLDALKIGADFMNRRRRDMDLSMVVSVAERVALRVAARDDSGRIAKDLTRLLAGVQRDLEKLIPGSDWEKPRVWQVRSKDNGVSGLVCLIERIWNIDKVDWPAVRRELAKYRSGRTMIRKIEGLPEFDRIRAGDYNNVIKELESVEKQSLIRQWEDVDFSKIEEEMIARFMKNKETGMITRRGSLNAGRVAAQPSAVAAARDIAKIQKEIARIMDAAQSAVSNLNSKVYAIEKSLHNDLRKMKGDEKRQFAQDVMDSFRAHKVNTGELSSQLDDQISLGLGKPAKMTWTPIQSKWAIVSN